MTSGAVPGVYLPPPTSQLRPPVPLSEREYNSFQPPVHNYSIWCLQISTVPSTLQPRAHLLFQFTLKTIHTTHYQPAWGRGGRTNGEISIILLILKKRERSSHFLQYLSKLVPCTNAEIHSQHFPFQTLLSSVHRCTYFMHFFVILLLDYYFCYTWPGDLANSITQSQYKRALTHMTCSLKYCLIEG